MSFKQAKWNEPLIFERSKPGKIGFTLLEPTEEEKKLAGNIIEVVPKNLLRENSPELPEVSEVEVVRHYVRLSQQNYGVDLGIYPLGSCTMKYTPKITDVIINNPKLRDLHPYQDEELTQGILQILYELSNYFAEILGMDKVSLQPAAGAHGEYTGVMIMRAYHALNGELDKRTDVIVPDSAHGTNPANTAMAGFKTVVVPSAEDGTVDLKALKAVAGEHTAGFMLTNPNTLGVFERNVMEIAEIIHDAGGLVYYDGANLNAILGKARPGDMGFDIAHINAHKTFSTPHGGGGPGAGPVGVKKELEKFLPVPTVEFDGKKYYLDYNKPYSIGKVRGFYGNIAVLVRAYAYILLMGPEGLKRVAELSVLNANYAIRKVLKAKGYMLPYKPENLRKHEGVVSAKQMMDETGVRALNVSKRLLDLGVHAPTNYFPLIVPEALMIEPTETESKETLDELINAFIKISGEAYSNPQVVLDAPVNTTVDMVDDVKASHPKTMRLSWRMLKKHGEPK